MYTISLNIVFSVKIVEFRTFIKQTYRGGIWGEKKNLLKKSYLNLSLVLREIMLLFINYRIILF